MSTSVSRKLVAAALLVVVSGGLVACGDDDGGGVRDLSEDDGSASGSGSASASGSGSASGSASGTEEATCSPVGEELEADATETVEIALREYEFDPSSITVEAGVVTFEATNEGTENHELAFLPGRGEIPLTADGAPDEDALASAGAFELEAFGPGQTCNATYEFEAGTYTLFCIVEAADGETHASKGMVGELTIE
jgi:plastocyanin